MCLILNYASQDLDLHVLMIVRDKQRQTNKWRSLYLVPFQEIENKRVVNVFRRLIRDEKRLWFNIM